MERNGSSTSRKLSLAFFPKVEMIFALFELAGYCSFALYFSVFC